MARTFVDDDIGYEQWLREHPEGYVLNCERRPTTAYLMLHRAGCHTLSGAPARDDSWTMALMKVVADAVADLEAWARAETGGGLQRCGSCVP